LKVNGRSIASTREDDGYIVLKRKWAKGDTVEITMGSPIEFHTKTYANQSWIALTRGPMVYATSNEVNVLPTEKLDPKNLHLTKSSSRVYGPAIEWVRANGRETVPFLPFYEAGGFEDDSKHFVWLPIKK
jgi:DUF1680 family protein